MSLVDTFVEQIPAYVADELDAVARRQVEEALVSSAALRGELEQYQRLFVLLTALAEEDVSLSTAAERRLMRHLAFTWYLGSAARMVEGLFGAYGRAILHYVGGVR